MSSPSPRRAVVGPSPIHGMGTFAGVHMSHGSSVSLGPLVRTRGWGGFNHSCRPNGVLAMVGGRTLLVILRDVEAGEELTVSYGDAGAQPASGCRCGWCFESSEKSPEDPESA